MPTQDTGRLHSQYPFSLILFATDWTTKLVSHKNMETVLTSSSTRPSLPQILTRKVVGKAPRRLLQVKQFQQTKGKSPQRWCDGSDESVDLCREPGKGEDAWRLAYPLNHPVLPDNLNGSTPFLHILPVTLVGWNFWRNLQRVLMKPTMGYLSLWSWV